MTSTAAAAAAATTGADSDAPMACESGNDFNGMLGLRISAIFVILIGSLLGMLDLRLSSDLLAHLLARYRLSCLGSTQQGRQDTGLAVFHR